MTTMHEFLADQTPDNSESKYDKIRREVSGIIAQHQSDYQNIIQRVDQRRDGLEKILRALTGEDEAQESATHSEQEEHALLEHIEHEPDAELIASASYDELPDERVEDFEESIQQLKEFSNSLQHLDEQCENLLEELNQNTPSANVHQQFVLEEIANRLFADQHQEILNAYDALQQGAPSALDLADELLSAVQDFSFASTMRDCDTALAYGSLVERRVSKYEIDAFKTETKAQLTEIANFTNRSQHVIQDLDVHRARAEDFNLYIDQELIDNYTNSSMHELYKHYNAAMAMLQARLAKATTFSEVETIEEYGNNVLQNTLFANQEVADYIHGKDGEPGLLAKLLDEKCRENNPYTSDLFAAIGPDSEFVELMHDGNEMINEIARKQAEKLRNIGGIAD